jgi:hypothetical protein
MPPKPSSEVVTKDEGVRIGPELTPPTLDRKLYRQILLPNGLRCVLIEDVLAGPVHNNSDMYEDDDEEEEDGESDSTSKSENGSDDLDGCDDDDDHGMRDAACCIVMGVGSMYDPLECQGLAHFLEHLLFM